MSTYSPTYDWRTLDARSLRIYWSEARSNAAMARVGKAFSGNYGSATEQDFAADLAFWEERQAVIEAELDRRGLEYE